MPARGRPAKTDKHALIDVLMNYKDRLIVDGQKVISKTDAIWITIARELENRMTPSSLYTFVSCNKYNVRDKLTDRPSVSPYQPTDIIQQRISEVSNVASISRNESTINNSTINNSNLPINNVDGVLTFTITMAKADFNAMIIHKTYRRKEKGRPPSTRQYTVLQPGTWQQVFTEKIWESVKLSCGFNFKRHKLISNGESGYAYGSCKCGSLIKCNINNTNELITEIKCKFIEGEKEGRCGKRYLRNPIRQAVVNELQGKSVMKYRVEMAEKLMQSHDDIEPPHLFDANVLRVAKQNINEKSYFDKNPIKALEIMQLSPFKNIIHNIGLNPFFVHYWSNYQLDVYRSYTLNETACINLDATGSIIRKIKRPDKSKTGSIFLYNCVVNSEKSGLFPVTQMLSERHNTNSIHYWLMEWIRSGAPRPREVICDFSRALLTAAIRSFTNYSTLDEYADACKEDNLPACYIRIDVAHFIKKYSNFLKDSRPRIKQFYLHVIGQLILCRDVEAAAEILKGILIITQSETEGNTRENEKTMCEEYKIKMKNLFTQYSEDVTIDNIEKYNDVEDEEGNNFNKWSHWIENINDRVKILLADNEGDRENAHYLPKLADYVMKDVKLLPLWSCIYRDNFGYGRIPASSASVEGDFNIIKNIMLKTEKTPMRADEFVTKHMDFISGRLKIAHANTENSDLRDIRVEENIPPSPKDTRVEENISPSPRDTRIEENINLNQDNNETVREDNIRNKKKCPACENGHEPTGGHTCYVCKKFVHALDGCSMPIGEEGYGQQRICMDCHNINNLQDIIATKEIEDWRGLATAGTKSKGRYLQKDSIQHEFLLDTNIRKIPIIKNGTNISLKSVKIGKNNYSLRNTCSFDSILQLFIAAYFDTETIKDLVRNETDFKFFELINEMVLYGTKRSSYRLRAMILKEIFSSKVLLNNCILINCEVTIGYLCRNLFQNHASFKEISKCAKDCPQRVKTFPLVQVKLETLLENNINQIEEDITIQGFRSCIQPNCDGLETTTISDIGQFILMETYSTSGTGEQYAVQLKDIPKKVKFSFMTDEYSLAGMVNFKAPAKQTRHSTDQDIGHYTAISYRRNKWIQYDDCKDAEKILNENYIASPHIILYIA